MTREVNYLNTSPCAHFCPRWVRARRSEYTCRSSRWKQRKRAGPPEEESVVGGTETILLAEDDESIRLLTKDVLTEFGYRVIEAVDGEDAVRKFVENSASIDLLLFDLIMPNMNGSEAFDEIRKVWLGTKAIFFSGYAPETIRQKVSLLDSTHLISKPIPPKELLRKVRSVLDSK